MGKRGALTSFLWKVITPCSPPSLLHRVSPPLAGQSLPQEGLGSNPEVGGGRVGRASPWCPWCQQAFGGTGTVLGPWSCLAAGSSALPEVPTPSPSLCPVSRVTQESPLSWGSPFTLRPAVAGPAGPGLLPTRLFRKGTTCSKGTGTWRPRPFLLPAGRVSPVSCPGGQKAVLFTWQ